MEHTQGDVVQLGHGLTLEPGGADWWKLTGPDRTWNSVPDVTAEALIAACGADWVCEAGLNRRQCDDAYHAPKGYVCGYRRDIVDITPPAPSGGPGEAAFDRADPATYGVPEAIDFLASLLGVADDETPTEAILRCLRPSGGPGPLPAGIEQASDGYLWVHGTDELPTGYQARGIDGEWHDADEWNAWEQGSQPLNWIKFPVRPVPAAPEMVRVPWWEAQGRKLSDGQIIRRVGCTELGPWVNTSDGESRLDVTNAVDPSGRVAVLPEGGQD